MKYFIVSLLACALVRSEENAKVKILHNLVSSKCPGLVSYDAETVSFNEVFTKLLECNRNDLVRKITPSECFTATSFTEAWRLDHQGAGHRPGGNYSYDGYACDFNEDVEWFKFSGPGGSKMLNSCPKSKSCGTLLPYWTDSAAPEIVGVKKTVDAYRSFW
ncbi:hypothetical protein EB796_004571 [Bugula neritina]|uniref:Uncharacterized protein n=1 Tax=Bugula neritina TaxID=10212 RepID=A0A7J7KGV9_BUGNE|nr:hypothetical protein EB796_004571 [Bugula neritina]